MRMGIIHNFGHSEISTGIPLSSNCTIFGNQSSPHSDLTTRAITLWNNGKIDINNSIIYGNNPDGIQLFNYLTYCQDCSAEINNSVVGDGVYNDQGTVVLNNVIDSDPLFCDSINDDFTLNLGI